MADSFEVDLDELRSHASNLRTIHLRFAAIREASSHISQDDEAYGQLCQFFPAILEGRHVEQDEAVDVLAENLELLAEAVGESADLYEEADLLASDDLNALEGEI